MYIYIYIYIFIKDNDTHQFLIAVHSDSCPFKKAFYCLSNKTHTFYLLKWPFIPLCNTRSNAVDISRNTALRDLRLGRHIFQG